MIVQNLKIIVAGRINSGKSSFIRSIDETEVIGTVYGWTLSDCANAIAELARQRNFRKNSGLEMGRVTVDDELTLSLHSVTSNLSSISLLPRDIYGYVLLIDSTNRRLLYERCTLLLYMAHFPSVPFMVVANKQDLPGALTVEQVRQRMRLIDTIPVIGCNATERDSVRNVLLELLYKILE